MHDQAMMNPGMAPCPPLREYRPCRKPIYGIRYSLANYARRLNFMIITFGSVRRVERPELLAPMSSFTGDNFSTYLVAAMHSFISAR
jgi:hypothetical protein